MSWSKATWKELDKIQKINTNHKIIINNKKIYLFLAQAVKMLRIIKLDYLKKIVFSSMVDLEYY